MIRKFGIPGDLVRMEVQGIVRRVPRSHKSISSRLTYVEAWVKAGFCPDLKGERHVKKGRVRYDAVQLPEELNKYTKDLYAGVSACRRLLDSGKLAEARERLESIERLVKDMEDRADPDRQRGQTVLAGSSSGGESRRGKLNEDTLEIIAYVAAGHSYGKRPGSLSQTATLLLGASSGTGERTRRNLDSLGQRVGRFRRLECGVRANGAVKNDAEMVNVVARGLRRLVGSDL